MVTKVKSGVIGDNTVGITQLNVSDGSNGQVLTTNGSGTLSFSTVSGGVDGISSSADATAITIGSDESVDFAKGIVVEGSGTLAGVYLNGTNSDTATQGNFVRYGTNFATQSNAANDVLITKAFNGSVFVDALNVKSDGKVGIGTTSPSSLMHLESGNAHNKLTITSTALSGTGYDASIDILGSASNSEVQINMGINGDADREQIKTYQSDMFFRTNNNNRMVIMDTGRIGMGSTTNPAALVCHMQTSDTDTTPLLFVENTNSVISANSELLRLKFSGDDNFSNCDYIKFEDSSGEEGVITGDGASRVYYSITSDYRKKENIVDYTGGLNVINDLRVRNYNMITRPDITYTGFIAHEVQDVVDNVARGEKDAVNDEGNPIYQSLDMSKLVPHLVSAIQELKTELNAAKARITTLEG